MLGQVFEKTGDKAKAIENYRKFLTLWKDANPGFRDLEDARKRLAGLKPNLAKLSRFQRFCPRGVPTADTQGEGLPFVFDSLFY
jgi:hypothetical protein